MILYINNEHCSSVEQLKGYFKLDLTPDSDIYADLLDYGRHGDIADWFREMDEAELASKVESISSDLSDSAFYAQLKAIITGTEVKDTEQLKPSFDKCFALEGVKCDVKDNEAKVTITFKVLMGVNEKYELCVSSNWGTRAVMVNPYDFTEGKTATFDFTLRKRPGKDIDEITVKAEGKKLSCKKVQTGSSNRGCSETINPYNYPKSKATNIDFLLRNKQVIKIDEITVRADGKESSNKKNQTEPNNVEILLGDIKIKMICVVGGTFTMGATPEMVNPFNDEKPTHQVTLDTYYIGETQVTQVLWEAVMGTNPSCFKGDYLPVERISWNDCQEFIINLNQKTGKQFRLPTEAEWEFAARGGNMSKHYQYSGSNNLDEVAWFNGNSGHHTHPVKTKKANELGIYDMSGNVFEWCSDWYSDYSDGFLTNLSGPHRGFNRVTRGGCFDSDDRSSRLSVRASGSPTDCVIIQGLRLALST